MKKTLFINANIIPMTDRAARFCTMGVCGDSIDYLGNEAPAGYDEVVDLKGKYIFPGLCDSHLHLLYSIVLAASAFNICSITKSGVKPDCISGIESEIRAYANNHPDQKLIVINQYITPAIAEHRMPTASELDEWCQGRKVVIFSIDGHSCAMSSSFMQSVGVSSPDGILFGSDYDMSQGKITGCIASAVSLGTLLKGIINFENECLSYGITKVCALDGDDIDGKKDVLLSLLVFIARRMDIKVRLFPQYMNYEKTAKIQRRMSHKRMGGCSKWELDGSVGSYSACFYHPYKNSAQGELYYAQSKIDSKIKEGLEAGYIMTGHAIGTKAIDQMVEAYRKSESLIPGKGPMCRIDHFEFPSKAALEFIKNHRLAITLQPGYAYLDKRYIKSYEQHLQGEDLALLCPVKELADRGVVILGSSDSPVQAVNPYDQMLGMMEYYAPEQSIDAYDALKTYTYNSSIALDENEGILAVGSKADFFVCSDDITAMDASGINTVRAETVYINGKKMKLQSSPLKQALHMLFCCPHMI